jgi:hypothetical protein
MSKLPWYRFARSVLTLVVLSSLCASSSDHNKKTPPKLEDDSWKSDPKFDSVVDKITAQEKLFITTLRSYQPMVETYIQNMQADKDLGAVPVSDEYFLGRIKMETGVEDVDFLPEQKGQQTSLLHKIFSSMQKLPQAGSSKPQRGGYMSDGFAQMVVMDTSTFDRQHYDFRFVRREFLGDVRTLVIDVKPKEPQSKAMFIGRIWAEEEQYHVVRLNGTYRPSPKRGQYLHFDSWRQNLVADQWLPAYVFSQETDLIRGNDYWNFRAQTLLWGYKIGRPNQVSEYTDIVVDSPDKIKDQSDSKQDRTGVEGERAWERQAEDNVLDRMQQAALLAPEGDVDKVLNTVVQNIELTNNLDVEPEIRCRVLLTQPLESFTVGHTIVISRGLLDTLPDEASLAAILAHEMGHIVSSHQINEKYAFSDVLIFPDQTTIENIQVDRNPEEEREADAKAMQFLQNSPYKDKLASAALFLAAMQAQAGQLTHLLNGNFGYPLLTQENGVRMSALVPSAPTLQVRDVKQIAALPLGERIKLEPWADQLTMQKTHPVNLVSANEKKPFQVTPRFPYLTRNPQVAAGASAQKIPPAADVTPAPHR